MSTGSFAGFASVIVPARNASDTLACQLDALCRQEPSSGFEVLIIDNASSDSTRAIAESYQDRLPLRVVSAPEVRGVNYVRNVGARAARGELLLYCDADDVVSDQWQASLSRCLDEGDAAGGPIEVERLNQGTVLKRGGLKGFLKPLGYMQSPRGCNFGVRRSVFEQLGGFDEAYRGGGDEVEFFWRLQLAGFSLRFCPNATVHYRYRTNLQASLRAAFVKSKQSAQLYRDFRAYGARRRSVLVAIGSWIMLLARTPYLFMGRRRAARWLHLASFKLGRIAGSIKYKVIFL